MQSIPFSATILQDGFWKQQQDLVRDVTIESVYSRFAETGRFDALRCDWREGQPMPHIFYDSDTAKWIESAAYLYQLRQDPKLLSQMESLIDSIESNQRQDGYFNSHFQAVEPGKRFLNRTDHELYCLGHLMEAAVAHFEATGSERLMKIVERYADLVRRVFLEEKSAHFLTPGHEEIELALVKMYRATGDKKYLEMADFFVEQRGRQQEEQYDFAVASYSQSHLPVREQTTAEGHSVRAMYLYCGMADLALEKRDKSLYEACKTLFDNVTRRRMYITGGIGSTRAGEAFTIDWDLPNATAYTETCAAIGLMLFARRMTAIEPLGEYADIVETCLYNGFLSGLSRDGKAFFYENPLEIHPELRVRYTSTKERTELPITQRKEVFDCSCCPPNVTRTIASLADFLYTYNGETLFVHQYIASSTRLGEICVVQSGEYPGKGHVEVKIAGIGRAALRIPGWCERFRLRVDGEDFTSQPVNGYVFIPIAPGGSAIDLKLDMPVCLIEADPHVIEDCGKVAVRRGPVVYCLEAVDNGRNLADITLPADAEFIAEEGPFEMPSLVTKGLRRSGFDGLYRTLRTERVETKLRFIPYYAFANRGETEMSVFVRVCL